MGSLRNFTLALVLSSALATPTAAADEEWNVCNNYRDHAKAIAACTRMIRDGSDKPMVWVYAARGVAYSWSKQYDAAIADFDVALRLDPKDSIAWGQRGIAHKLKGNRTQALADLQTAVALDSKNDTAAKELEKLRSGR